MEIKENYSLKNLNTFHINAFAKYFIELNSTDDILEFLSEKKYESSKRFVLGGGSNVLFTRNFDGFILKNNIKGIQLVKEDSDYYYVKANGGEVWHQFVMHCVNNNYAGLENMSLIPGCVGAGPIQNIGAYGVELKDNLYEVEAIYIPEKKIHTLSNSQCKFGYRDSIFKNEGKEKYIITAVTFKLRKQPVFNTQYGAIEKELEVMGVKEISIAAISKAVCNIRSSKLPDPEKIGNAGSFFKNPVISKQLHDQLKSKFSELVSFKNTDNDFKLAAGWLIEQCGWKGKTIGEAGVHKNQALVLVNYGNATGKEIYDISTEVLKSVKDKFGVDLEREVNII